MKIRVANRQKYAASISCVASRMPEVKIGSRETEILLVVICCQWKGQV